MEQEKRYIQADVAVIGGGAAGLMAAGQAAYMGRRVVLIEKNRTLGKKLRITGKGRCNLTSDCDRDYFMQHLVHNGSFLYSAYHIFSPQDTIRFFKGLGVELKVERGKRVFPVSDSANEVAEALIRFCKEQKVTFLRASVSGLCVKEGAVTGVFLQDNRQVNCRRVIMATGGLSYPATGSTGEGLLFAKKVGHRITPCRPSLVPIELDGDLAKNLQGLSLKNVELIVCSPERKNPLFRQRGELIFTHYGISGPLVLTASAYLEEDCLPTYTVWIDLKPALTMQQLDQRLLREIREHPGWELKRMISELLPRRLIETAMEQSGISPHRKVGQISREERLSLIELMKKFPLHARRFRPLSEAIVTSGGVDVSMVFPKTMESKICKGLYFAGEMLDIDGLTGGFHLQIAWSTGYVAGVSAGDRREDDQ